MMDQKQILKFQQLTEFDEKLWCQGQEIGTINGSLRFINFPFLEQMPIGVLSNSGIEFSSKPILQASSLNKTELGKNLTFKGIIEEKTKLMKNDRNES